MNKFDKPIKIYLFKNKNMVSLSFFVTSYLTNQYNLKITEFEKIISSQEDYMEFESELSNTYWLIEKKSRGPRPEKKPCKPFMRVSISTVGTTAHYRFYIDDWSKMISEYLYQKNSVMHWDNDV